MSTAAVTPVFDPQGTLRSIPNDQLQGALSAGGKLAVQMKDPSGTLRYVPHDMVDQAQQAGGTVAPQAGAASLWQMVKEYAHDPLGKLKADFDAYGQQGRQMLSDVQTDPNALQKAAQPTIQAAQMAGTPAPAAVAAAQGLPAVESATPTFLKNLGSKLYQSALKPSTTLGAQKTAQIVQTGLDNAIPVSQAGIEKLGSLIDDVNQKIADTIAANPSAPINKFKVASRLGDTAQKFATQVSPTSDLNAISDVGNDFLATQPGNIPASQAQALKQGTYQQLAGRSYGELKGATIEAQKALARGLKEELVTQFPELGDLNAQDSKFLQLDPILERAVSRIGNHQLLGIGTPIAGGAAKAVTGSNAVAATVGALKAVVDNPAIKSRLAIAISKSGVPMAQASARVAAYSAALAQAAYSANNTNPDTQSGQTQP